MSEIFLAPFSNSDIRDWPLAHFSELIGLLLDQLPESVFRVIGAPSQKLRTHEVVRAHPANRVTNDCGRWTWAEVLGQLKHAACIVSNNSGVGHLGGYFGVPTVCVFGGSHARSEWRPLGRSVVLVSRVIGCSPCDLDHNSGSPYGKACLREISPGLVAAAVRSGIARRSRGTGTPAHPVVGPEPA